MSGCHGVGVFCTRVSRCKGVGVQERVQQVIAKRNQLQAEVASKTKVSPLHLNFTPAFTFTTFVLQNMDALREAKLAGPRAVMQMVTTHPMMVTSLAAAPHSPP